MSLKKKKKYICHGDGYLDSDVAEAVLEYKKHIIDAGPWGMNETNALRYLEEIFGNFEEEKSLIDKPHFETTQDGKLINTFFSYDDVEEAVKKCYAIMDTWHRDNIDFPLLKEELKKILGDFEEEGENGK